MLLFFSVALFKVYEGRKLHNVLIMIILGFLEMIWCSTYLHISEHLNIFYGCVTYKMNNYTIIKKK